MKKKSLKSFEYSELELFIDFINLNSGRMEELLVKKYGEGSFPVLQLQQIKIYANYLQEKLSHSCEEDFKNCKKKPSKKEKEEWLSLFGKLEGQYREDA
jgi:hypothetical protein